MNVRSEDIVDPGRIFAVLRGLCAGHAGGRVRLDGGGDGGPACVAAVAPDRLQLEFPGTPATPPFDISFGYFNSVFTFRIVKGTAREDRLDAAIPDRLVRRRLRLHRRAPAPRGATVSWRGSAPRALVDASVGGFAFRTRDELPGERELAEVTLRWPNRGVIRGRAEIRHVAGGVRCGVRFVPASVWDRDAWTAVAAERLYGNTAVGSGAPGALWDLYARAGYFELSGKHEEEFISRRQAFAAANRRLSLAPAIGCQVSWPSPRGVEAAVTLLKPYARAWVGFQLARRRDGSPAADPRSILREVILHGYEYPQRDPDFEWLITWVQTSGRFSRLLMHDLTSRWGDLQDQAAIVRFHALEAPSDRPLAVPRSDVGIGPPHGDELAAALAAIAAARPRPYVAAHDLVPARFDLAGVRAAWRAAKLARERDALVARRDGRLEAIAVLELAEDGVHLYGLFDVVRLYEVAPGGAAAFPALLEAARLWYRARGKRAFVYFCEDVDPGPAAALGFTDLGGADMTILAADLLPEQLEHAWEITTPRDVEAAVP